MRSGGKSEWDTDSDIKKYISKSTVYKAILDLIIMTQVLVRPNQAVCAVLDELLHKNQCYAYIASESVRY